MPKLPNTPRLSIIIPIGDDLDAFESTLVSVLENRPADCEVLVADDGSYDDPFDLGDEVRFVVGASENLIDLIAASTVASRGRIIHVLAPGLCATDGWIDAAIEKFEHHDAAVVTPVIRHAETQQIVAAGWHDSGGRLCTPASSGQQQVADEPQRVGAYLHGSFWRREILVSMPEAFTGRDVVAASYAYEQLIRAAGWRCVLAPQSHLLFDRDRLPWDQSSLSRGKTLRAIRSNFHRNSGWKNATLAATRAVIANLARPSRLAEAIGQALATSVSRETKRKLQPATVQPCREAGTVVQLADRQRPIRADRAA